jgi:hypothetical protein
MEILRKSVKNIITSTRTYLDNQDRNQNAYKHLKVIEEEKGKLSVSDKKLCNEYAMDVLGNKVYAPWLYVYCAFSREFKEGWIPDNYYGQHVIPNINGTYGQICHRKAVINSLLKVHNSLDICYYVNYLFLNENHEVLKENTLKKILFSKSEKIVFKLETGEQGKGIYFFDEESFDVNVIKKLGNGVFQNYIEQHQFLSNFTNSSVATIRVLSVCDDHGNISIRAGMLKFARGNNTHCMGPINMKIPYDITTGKLYDNAYFGDWKSTEVLPDNDFPFAGKVLPSFNNCLAEVKRMHGLVPFARCLGWDLIVDKNSNVLLIEVNGGHSGIRFSETFLGPCFLGLNWENSHR